MTSRQWTKADPKWCRIETVVHGVTIGEAIQKVIANHGSAGVDRVTVRELDDYWKQHGETIRQKIIEGTYIPLPVKRVDIPKPNGRTRMLGIPSVIDRVIQRKYICRFYRRRKRQRLWSNRLLYPARWRYRKMGTPLYMARIPLRRGYISPS